MLSAKISIRQLAEMANVRQVSETVPSIGCTVWHAQLVRLGHSTAGPAE